MSNGKKRIRNPCYEEVYNWDNLLLAWSNAAKGKRYREAAARFELDLGENLARLRAELRDHSYHPGPYNSFYIHDPKRRLISAAPFRDRVVHHALCNVIVPVFERGFIHDSYANRVGKGTHAALRRAQEFCRRFPYVMSCDVRQFFPSIDHKILRSILARLIRDGAVLTLIDKILHSGAELFTAVYRMVYFPGDDLFAALRPRGLPIGNLTSQFWANCYLDPVDHFVKRELRCKGYVRYVDDMLLFGNSTRELYAWKLALMDRLARHRLTIHEKRTQAAPTRDGVPFLGFVVSPRRFRLKRRKGIAYQRRLRRMAVEYHKGRIDMPQVSASVRGWVGHAAFGDTGGLRRAVFKEVKFVSASGA